MPRPSNHGSPPINGETIVPGGSTQTDAAQIPLKLSPAIVVAAGDDITGIKLPPATKGKMFCVKNVGTGGVTSKLNVYPATGDAINAAAVNVALQMGAATSAIFIALNSTTWYTFPTVPS